MPGVIWLLYPSHILPLYVCPFSLLAMMTDNGVSFLGGVGVAFLIAICNAAYYAIVGSAVSAITYPLWKSN
jgi:hypothetical protein